MAPVTGCATEAPRSLGSIETARELRESPAGAGENSEWETLRESLEPAWAKEPDSRAQAIPEAGGSGAASEDGKGVEDGDGDSPESSPEEPRTPAGGPNAALMVVDHEHGLPPDYVPEDLAPLHPLGIPTLRGERMKLREAAAEATARMLADAREAGFELLVCSAYRSHEAQAASHDRLTAIYGEAARDFSAPPGHSEHQLGTVIDVSNASVGYRLHQDFGETRAAEWLRRNAAGYGFVLSYPRGAEEHTDYRWEPWHYRYIGRENALAYHEGDHESPQQFFAREGAVLDE